MEKVIRIAQIMGKWLGGGVESVVMNYYRNIDRNKIQFDFICDSDSTDIPYEEIEKLGGKVIIIPPYQEVKAYHKELKRVLKEGNYKIVHSHINTLSVFSLFAAKRAGVPVRIAHSHSTTNKKEKKKHLMKMVLRPFSKVFATNYMCCSEYAGKWQFGEKAYSRGEVYLLNNAIDISKFKYNRSIRKEKRSELQIKEDTFVVGNVGRFVETKNHDFLIDVFNEIHKMNKNTVLLLIGQGTLMDKIKEKVKKLGLIDNVKFLGQRDDVGELYQAMDVFVLPSLYEGLGMVLVEAEAAGLKCITSTFVPREVDLVEGNVFFKDFSNPKEWAKNAIGFYNRNVDLTKLEELYDIKKQALKLENYYLSKWGD